MKTLTTACLLSGLAFLSAQATTITFDGQVVTSHIYSSAQPGEPFRAVFFFPNALITPSGGSSWRAEWMLNYEFNLNPDVEFLPWADLRVTCPSGVNSFDQIMGVLTVAIQNDGPAGDSLTIVADLEWGTTMHIYLLDPSGTALDSAAFPSHMAAADWAHREFALNIGAPGHEWYGQIDRITVPDSGSTLTLIALSLGALALGRCRKPLKPCPTGRSFEQEQTERTEN